MYISSDDFFWTSIFCIVTGFMAAKNLSAWYPPLHKKQKWIDKMTFHLENLLMDHYNHFPFIIDDRNIKGLNGFVRDYLSKSYFEEIDSETSLHYLRELFSDVKFKFSEELQTLIKNDDEDDEDEDD